MKYKISYENPSTQYVPIEAEIPTNGQENMLLQFPAWRPGRYELGNFAKNIHGFMVLDQDLKKLNFRKVSKDSWEVNCSGASLLVIRYKYYSAELNAGSTYMDDRQLYVNPVNCLVYDLNQQNNPCSLELDIPENFEVASGAKVGNNTLLCEDYHELVDSPFICSADMQHEEFKLLDVDFHIWVLGDVKMDWDRVIKDFKDYTMAQFDKFGVVGKGESGFPVKEYHYLFQIPSVKAYHGVEHQTGTVIALGPASDLMEKMYDEFLHISSHELYHTWNVKAIRPKEMAPYDYSRENYSNLGYVAEGVTTYLGDLFLSEAGVKDFGWYKKVLETSFQRHFDNFGRFNYSVAESSWDTWLDGYVPGAPNRKVSIYNEGAILSLITDLKIRNASENRESLHSVMKALYEDYAKKGIGYSEKNFQTVVERFYGSDLTEYFENYYRGVHSYEPILIEALEFAGLGVEMAENPDKSTAIAGIKTISIAKKTIIKQIYPGSSAELGGLMLEDEIVGLNGEEIKDNLAEIVEKFQDDELTFTISRMGRTLELTCPHTNKSYFPVYSVVKLPTPSNLAKRIFKKWCGYVWDEIKI